MVKERSEKRCARMAWKTREKKTKRNKETNQQPTNQPTKQTNKQTDMNRHIMNVWIKKKRENSKKISKIIEKRWNNT